MAANLFGLDGQIALVTGSSMGIGYALARGLGRAGARLVLNGRDRGWLGDAATSLSGEGLSVHQAVFDVTRGDEVRDAIGRVEFGGRADRHSHQQRRHPAPNAT